jgi:hypothetical protein
MADETHQGGKVRYTGQWKKSLPHGKGVMDYHDGGRYQGQWILGLKHGIGIEVYANQDR